jgi:iron complex outermembrane receptor protein
MTRLRLNSLSATLLASTVLAPSFAAAQDIEDTEFLGTLVLRAINDGGAGVSTNEAANTSGSRVPVDPDDLPRAVTILPRELFEAQGARTMEETVAYSPGIVTETYGQDDRYDEFVLRGFEAQIGGVHRDAMPLRTIDWASWRTEPFGLESVNILRGPTSDLYGANQPGGLINGVTKRPEFTFGGEFRAALTAEQGKELGVDVTGPISDTLAYRFVGLVNSSGTSFDAVDSDRVYIAPSLTFAPSDTTTFTLYGQYQKDNVGDTYASVPEYGSRETNPLGSFGPDTYTGNPDYNDIKTTQNYVGYEFEHEFSPSFTFMSRARLSKNDWDNKTEFVAAYVNMLALSIPTPTASQLASIDTAIMSRFDVDQEVRQNSFDNALHYSFDTGSAKGSIAIGVDHYSLASETAFAYGYAGDRNLFTGAVTNNLAGAIPPDLPSQRNTDLKQTGLYLNGFAEFGEKFVAAGGLRFDKVKYDVTGSLATPVPNPPGPTQVVQAPLNHSLDETYTSGNVSLGYRVNPETLVFGAVSQSFNLPPSGMLASGDALSVETSKSYELGVKYASLDGNSSISASIFNITKQNVAYVDPNAGNSLVYVQAGEVRSRGIEVEATHDFQNGLSLFGSVAYVDPKITKDPRYQGNRPGRTPKISASLFAQYEVQQIDGLAFGLGVRHAGSRYSDVANTIKIDPVTLFDASVSYDTGDWQVRLAGRNLADNQSIGYCAAPFIGAPLLPAAAAANARSCVYSAGREVSLTLSRKF